MKNFIMMALVFGCVSAFADVADDVLFNFSATTLYQPAGQLMVAPNGLFYGTAAGGGTGGWGGVFQLDTSTNPATYTTVWNATAGATVYPQGPVAIDSTGNIYLVTQGSSLIGDCCGSVVKLTYDKTTGLFAATTLHTFAGGTADGANPLGGVILDSSNNLYGTTSLGGDTSCSNGCGVIWKLAKAGTGYNYSILHMLKSTEGGFPSGRLTINTSIAYNNTAQLHIFGTAKIGGAGSLGSVFEYTPAVTGNPANFKVLYSFPAGGANGANPTGAVYFSENGLALFGTTAAGGSANAGTVFQISGPANTETVIHSFTGNPDGQTPSGNLIADANGNLFLVTAGGGTAAHGALIKLALQTNGTYLESVEHNFIGSPSDAYQPAGGLIFKGTTLYGISTLGGPNSCAGNSCGVFYSLIPQ